MKAAIAAFFELPLEGKNKYAQAGNDFQGYGQAYVASEEQKLNWCDMGCYRKILKRSTKGSRANISLLMGMARDGLKRFYGKTKQAMRMNYYPPCSRPDLVLGINPHSDPDIVTLLLQDDEVPGLQIRHKDEWILVKPIRNLIMILSNGVYKSIEHRAITNESKARLSLATIMIPYDELEIGPVECAVDDDRPRMYGNMKYLDYVRYTLGRKMDGKSSP